ncbi:MAG: polysaccharide pyruvyl transferase family protein [Paracoccaceae bacterium]
MRSAKWCPNYGDSLVCAAILRQIAPKQSIELGIGRATRAQPAHSLIRGSTYLHVRFDFEASIKEIDALDGTTAIVGLGAQHPVADPKFLDSYMPARNFIACLNEKSTSISVRGAFSAEVVARLGGKNIRVTGCPSLFYHLSAPKITPPVMLAGDQRRLGISLHTGLMKNMYCSEPVRALAMHGRLITYCMARSSHTALFEQGVLREYDVADPALSFEDRFAAAEGILASIDKPGRLAPTDLIARMVSVQSVEEWLARMREIDAMLGFRFHGNLVALISGKPAFFYTYDSRIDEFCALYNLPHQFVMDEWTDPINAMIEHDWADTNARFDRCLSELRAFYTENNIAHQLH